MKPFNTDGVSTRRVSLRRGKAVLFGLSLACAFNAKAWDDVDGPAPGAPEPIGSYAAGCLIGGVRLPDDGTGFLAVRPARNRHYGHPELIGFIETLSRESDEAGLGLLPIGDMSQPRGGPMSSDHASHQIGLDVDIFFRLDLPRLQQDQRGEDLELPSFVDYEHRQLTEGFGDAHTQLLRRAASAPNVERIFVSPVIKKEMCERDWADRSFLNKLRPWYGHDDHMHVRLDCPPDSLDCVPQAAPPPGDGCGAELTSWIDTRLIPTTSSSARRTPELPMRCDALH
jgi:penicillin-insensitive murein endopeptidase